MSASKIMFRGHVGDEGFVYGVPIEINNQWYIIDKNEVKHPVSQESIDEYTRINTVENVPIFEHDIIRFNDENYLVCRECDLAAGTIVGTAFVLLKIGTQDYIQFDDTTLYGGDMFVEVIGSKTLNPELVA